MITIESRGSRRSSVSSDTPSKPCAVSVFGGAEWYGKMAKVALQVGGIASVRLRGFVQMHCVFQVSYQSSFTSYADNVLQGVE